MIEFFFGMSDGTKTYFTKIKKNLDEPRAVLKVASEYMKKSVDENFRAQGRPKKWKGLAPLTIRLRRKGRKRKSETREEFQLRRQAVGIKILQDTGRLKGSITARVFKHHAVVGTGLKYAKLHQKGGMSTPSVIKRGKRTFNIGAHKVPKREFLLFQKEDFKVIDKFFKAHAQKAISN